MTRQERVALHKKQERLQVRKGVPSVADMKEGVPELRYVDGAGLTEYTKFNNVLHEKTLDKSNEAKEEASQPAPVEDEVVKEEIPKEVFTQKLLDELECGVNPHKLMCLEKFNEASNTSSDTPHTDDR